MSDKKETAVDMESNYIADGKAHGDIAKAIMGNEYSLMQMAKRYRNLNFSALPANYWKYIDDIVHRVAREQLVGMKDIQAAGGFVNMDRRAGTAYEYYKISEMSKGNFAMTPDERGTADVLDFSTARLALPIAKKEFWVEVNLNSTASRNGFDLMMALTEAASFQIANELEEFLFNGLFELDANLKAYGYTKWPDRNIFDTAAGFVDWKTLIDPVIQYRPDLVLKQLVDMVEVLFLQNHYGPYKLYIPKEYSYILSMDYTTGTTEQPVVGTIRDRLMMIEGLSSISVSRKLADNNILLVELTPSSVQIVNGIPLTVMDWEPPNSPNWRHEYKAMACMVPLFKSDYNGQNGILHGYVG